MYIETWKRSVVKTISYRLAGSLGAMGVVLLMTRRWSVALAAGGFDAIFKLALYYVHERLWNASSFGKIEVTPAVLWFTGLPSSGKTTMARHVYEALLKKGVKAQFLDGDTIRSIFPQTGFSREERNLHIMRAGYLASVLEKQGIFVVAALVSPYTDSRTFVRGLCSNFIEVHVSTPVEVCEQRDEKGLYAKARRGEIKAFTGVSDPYEAPESPDMRFDTAVVSHEQACGEIMGHVTKRFFGR